MPCQPWNSNAMYVALVGDHFQLMIPKGDLQTFEALSQALEDQLGGVPALEPITDSIPNTHANEHANKRRKFESMLKDIKSNPETNGKSTETNGESIETNGKKCCVCLDRDVNTVFVPCGHAVMCSACALPENLARMQHKCPTCRQEYFANIPLYF